MIKRFIISIILMMPLVALCQPQLNSPYSRFGLDDINDRNFYTSRFMGGLGASYTDPYQINIVNPAALAHMNVASFDIGLYAENYGLRNGATDNNPEPGAYNSLWTGNLSYMSLALPLQNRVNDLLDRKQRDFTMTTAFSLLPYSDVGHDIATISEVEGVGEVKQSYEGEGGSYQFVWSNGARYKNFSFGFNLGYFFGKIENASILEFDLSEPYFNSVFTETNRLSGFLWDVGAIYTLKLNKNQPEGEKAVGRYLNFGIHGHSKTGFTSKFVEVKGAVQNGSGIENILETQDFSSYKRQRRQSIDVLLLSVRPHPDKINSNPHHMPAEKK